MGVNSEMHIAEQQPKVAKAPRSMFNIRQDHLSLLAMIEEQDGLLEEDQVTALQLSEDEFKDKAISYGFVVLHLEGESDIIDAEIKRLQARKAKVDKRAEMFRDILDQGMRQFGHDKIATPTLTLSYRASTPVELAETFQDDLLQYCDVSISISDAKLTTARDAGIEPMVSAELVELFDLKVQPSKTRIAKAIKEGVQVPGASMPGKKNLQIN